MEKELKNIHIPLNFLEINIAGVMVFSKVAQMKTLSDTEKMIQVIANLNDMDVKEVRNLPGYMIDSYSSDLAELFNGTLDQTEYDPEDYRIIEIEGKEYGLIPNFNKTTMGAYIDLETYIQNIDKGLHKIMAVLYRPVTKRMGNLYEISSYVRESDEEFEERAELFLSKMPYAIARSVVNFLMGNI